MKASAFAPAKINLTLHVTGRRPDGYHLLDSLVLFVDVGDRLTATRSREMSLSVSGPMADGVPTDASNLVMQAANLVGVTAALHLEKHLPAAAGIGGGSADAAATLRALSRLSGQPLVAAHEALQLGADVPVCLDNSLARMRGIGEQIERPLKGPDLSLLLVNPRISVPTPEVFKNLQTPMNEPMGFPPPCPEDQSAWISWLATQRNDLEPPAITAQPIIASVLSQLRGLAGCQLGRMSGSGATCFAIFQDDESCAQALAQVRRDHPNWWSVQTRPSGAEFS